MYCTYILFSPSTERYYIGQTHDLSRRLGFHRAGNTAVTACAKDWQLVFLEHTVTRADAMALESKIKRAKSKKSIQRYIADPRNEANSPRPLADW